MKRRILLSLVLILSILLSSVTVYAATYADGVGKEEIPYGEFQSAFKPYGYNTFLMMTADEAKAAGVPEGYSGYVLKLEGGSSGVGFGLDLTQYRVSEIESITFRIWCPAETKSDGVRLTNTSQDSWIMLADPGATEQWVEVVLSKDSNFNTKTKSFEVFDDGNGYCKRVNFVFRYNASSATAYVDSITVKLREADTTPPVITYDGATTVETTAGRTFQINATAYDAYYDTAIEPAYIFSEGAVDGDGLLLEGEHSCTVRFTDPAGNFSELKLSLKVAPKDTVAPVLSWAPDKIYANSGMMPMFNVTAIDDRDGEVKVTVVWSEGAIYRGKLCAGNHTLTITASDETGNKTEKVIPVVVADYAPPVQG